MATRPATVKKERNGDVLIVTWTNLAAGDVGGGFYFPEWPDRCVQIIGHASNVATVSIIGSNNGFSFSDLTDVHGNALTGLEHQDMKQITEVPLLMLPSVSAGAITTAYTVIVVARRTNSYGS